MTSQAKPELVRQVFTTSRELEYFSESELVTQTGYRKEEWWPGVLVKELVDNGLDACEQAGIAPEITVEFTGDSLTVSDNGPGIPPEVVERVLDFATRTSDKAAYVSPTRGAQGNALKTVLAIPYVLNGGRPSIVTIQAQGIRHLITVATDHIVRRPQIDHEVEEVVRTPGTVIRIELDSARSEAVVDTGILTTPPTGLLAVQPTRHLHLNRGWLRPAVGTHHDRLAQMATQRSYLRLLVQLGATGKPDRILCSRRTHRRPGTDGAGVRF